MYISGRDSQPQCEEDIKIPDLPECEEDIKIPDHYVEQELDQGVLKEADGDMGLTVNMRTSNNVSDFVAGLTDK